MTKHQVRRNHKKGGVSIYILKSLNFKIRKYFNVNNKDIESLSVEILSDKERNTLFNAL